ncbi:MAG: hypothetical protein H7831_12635, partial [Magnetococcus sp. WYHC-3]
MKADTLRLPPSRRSGYPAMIHRLNTADPDFQTNFERLLAWESGSLEEIERRVATIIADVRARGDAALV